uniref:Uncharacterized protein n=1 Tax=Tetranychus urticae TaxID=32264 RepID=T1JSP7_TETUR
MCGKVFSMGKKVAFNHLPKIHHKRKKISNVCKCKTHPYTLAINRIDDILARHPDPEFSHRHRKIFDKYLDDIYSRWGLPNLSEVDSEIQTQGQRQLSPNPSYSLWIRLLAQALNACSHVTYVYCISLDALHCKKFQSDFNKASKQGHIDMVNIPYLQKKLITALKDNPVFRDHARKPDSDLLLDTRLIKGLCTLLRNYGDNKFGTPGGDEGDAYRDITGKLVSQLPGTRNDFMLTLNIKFVAGYNSRTSSEL